MDLTENRKTLPASLLGRHECLLTTFRTNYFAPAANDRSPHFVSNTALPAEVVEGLKTVIPGVDPYVQLQVECLDY